MAKANRFLALLYAFSLVFLVMGTRIAGSAHGKQRPEHHYVNKLFVFGDSYVDTGNLGRLLGRLARSWFDPYGMTFPRKPTGRFSDGRVLTDYVASFLRIRSPIPYRIRKFGQKLLPYGMNFAVAGSGIFDTGNFQSNLTAQIDKFQAQIDDGVFSRHDLKSSAALIAVSGNDYQFLSELDPDYLHVSHLHGFMHRLFAQLKVDLKRLSHIGVPEVIVTNLHPIGCVPYYTRPTKYTACYSNVSSAVAEHNRRVDELMQELGGGSDTTFLSLDVNTAFLNVLHRAKGAKEIKHPLVPCCESRSNTTECGEIDAEGNRLYRVCRRPEEHLYWDSVHPTQAGWAAAFEFLRPSLREFLRL
ncbi:unnamed protein product [Musa acuminata subsp. malaccensis]|uniref:(wild Malaysian banana) hypothetical protein n=1 Tax=Musa acuminata subsp. malaccensis TaxID=214687 RepID=A0A8D7ALY7_MUSAM|nr:unnamed protein product [Musa acuminata subsp. malaccensis]